MFISADQPTRSLRSVTINGEEMVLIVGESHKTGQGIETMEHYKALETFGEEVFGLEEIVYRWSAQDLITLDKLPYIGELTSGQPNILIATGYQKMGNVQWNSCRTSCFGIWFWVKKTTFKSYIHHHGSMHIQV